ncbi:hypothetical protein [Caulobacter sp. NIBR1757]|uniref:hypothetical protein n=1 Tax=Caulobacter sp. NIBR1757 TaxID=3016000 RepID=UPI0022F0775A|nr:hypothetical protein [Caulobacter sp. NIBR1757]WGM37379.1 hypothetical protein AMEJIAPC_00277 [Caulobacter sp. NIBR1757]
MIRHLPLIALLALAACGKPAEQKPTAPVAEATEATVPEDAKRAAEAWTASNDGVGPVGAGTAFKREAIAALFPDSAVETAFLAEEGVQTPIITVSGPRELVLELKGPDRVGAILAQGGPVIGPRGEMLMAPFPSLTFKAGDCVIGADRFSGAALCRRAPGDALAYVIGRRGELSGNPGDAPDSAQLAEGFLREFLWQSPLK